jgi:serine/threonine-protein kinase
VSEPTPVESPEVAALAAELREALAPGLMLVRELGQGGMGTVFLARDPALKRNVVVKVLSPALAVDESARRRFAREAEAAAAVAHPNVVSVFQVGELPRSRTSYFVMQHVEGPTLEAACPIGTPVPVARAKRIVGEMASALAAAHARGLVHRDVKPANVMLCERGGAHDVVKVLDFGLVKELGAAEDAEVTSVGHVVGTPHYMAPEAVIAAGNVSARSDVYAVGAVAYALVTGQQVFGGKSGAEIIGHHLHTAPVSPSERLGHPIDSFLERLILACLAKRPEERPADAGAVLRQIEEGWTGPVWTQREAREWWQVRAPAMLAARRAAEASASRAPELAVDVASRVRSESLPELSLDSGTRTALRPRVAKEPSKEP